MRDDRRGELYRRLDALWDWRVKAANGEVVATSGGQGFTERGDAREAAEREHPDVTFVDAED